MGLPKFKCPRHGGSWGTECKRCKELEMAKVRKVLSVTRKPEGSDWMMKIRWELRDGIWEAQRQMPGVNEWADLPDLNSVNMVDVFKAMRDILAGTIDKELLSPIGD